MVIDIGIWQIVVVLVVLNCFVICGVIIGLMIAYLRIAKEK